MWKKNWHSNKYINFVKDIINPKFLIDLITPRDIFSIIKTLNIKRLQINKNYYIKSICKYDIVLNSTNKTSKKLVKELYQ